MYLARHNNRTCIFGFSGLEGIDVFKEAYKLGILQEDTKIFLGSGRFFCVLKNDLLRTYRMRENWNGWHDLAIYTLPDFVSIGKKVYAKPSEGLHRDIVTL